MDKELERSLEKISNIKNKMLCGLECECDKSIKDIDTDEAGKVADMIKDLSEAEEKCVKACYYKTVIHAMKEYDNRDDTDEWDDRAGYDHWRYGDGRFAPAGKGNYSGFTVNSRVRMPRPEIHTMAGYDRNMPMNGNHSVRGARYDEYDEARRHYTESGMMMDREQMNEKAKMYMGETIMSIKDIWNSADPEMKKRMKTDLANLINELT